MSLFLVLILKKGLKLSFIVLSGYIILIFALWFSNTFYKPYPQKENYMENELISLSEKLIIKANNLYTAEFDIDEILRISPSIMNVKTAKVKYSRNSSVLNDLNLSGIFIPFTGQALINSSEHAFLLPFIASHELSHRCGILDEGQANMHAYVRCLDSDIPSFQYSASVYALKYAMDELKTKNEAEYFRLAKSIDDCVLRDLNRMGVNKSRYRVFDYASLISCLIEYQSITSHGVI